MSHRPYDPARDPDSGWSGDIDAALKEQGWAAGLDVWDAIGKYWEQELDEGGVGTAQLWSLREAVRAEYAAELLRAQVALDGEREVLTYRVPESSGRPELPLRLRQGRSQGRNLYVQAGDEPSGDDQLTGQVDSPELAVMVCAAVNARFAAPPALGRHEDERGVIQDLLAGPLDMVTQIDTGPGAVRGNHTHLATTQWTYIVHGRLLVAWQGPDGDGVHTAVYPAGSLVVEEPGIAHAWQAIEATRVLVFTRGPRAGEDYENDTVRLPENARLLPAKP